MSEQIQDALTDPALTAPLDPAAVVPEPTPEPAPEPSPEPVPEPQHGNAGKQPWFVKAISDRDAELEQTRRELAAARELAERLQAGDTKTSPPDNQRSQQVDPELVRREAQRQRFLEDVNDLKSKGLGQFGQAFNETINTLTATGAATDDFVADVMAVDKANAHILLATIAKDPERAVALAQMNSRQRIAELTRMTMAPASTNDNKTTPTTPKTTVSRAPAPPPPLNPGGKKAVDWRADDASDDEFDAGFREMMERRHANNRRLASRG